MSRSAAIRRLIIAVLAGVGCGVAATCWLLLAGWLGWIGPMTGPVADGGWTDRSRAWITARGFLATDIDQTGQRSTWTADGGRLVLTHLDRRTAHDLTFTLAAPGRPAGIPQPTVSWLVDARASATLQVGPEFQAVRIRLPESAASRAVVTFRVDPTFDPGPHDERMLGVVIRDLTLTPESGRFRLAWSAIGLVSLAIALAVFGVLACGLPSFLDVVASAGILTAFLWLALLDGGFLGTVPETLVELGGVTAAAGLAVFALSFWRTLNDRVPDWAAATGLILAATMVKLAFFSHPQITIGDGWFQVHRAQLVVGGQYYFTSVTPRPFFEFPYAVALYVTALPFWSWVPRGVEQVWLLRVCVLAADALAGLAMFVLVRRVWSPAAAMFVAGLWPFARAPLEALCNSNLTNVYGQSLFAIGMAGLAWTAVGAPAALLAAVASTAIIAAAFLSHFSTASVGIPLLGVVAASLVVGGVGRVRWKSVVIAGVCAAAMLISYAVYYRHFGEVYEKTIARVMSQEPVQAEVGSSIAATPLVKLRRWATGGSDDYGLPGLPLAAASVAGLLGLWRDRRRDPWTLMLGAWLLVWVGFTALGILSSVQMRVNLAAAPVFVCLGAYGLSRVWSESARWRPLAALVTVLVVVDSVRLWLMCLGR